MPSACVKCGHPTQSGRHWYCLPCKRARKRHKDREREKARVRATPAQRGYGAAHRALKDRWRPLVAAGGVACARCGRLIKPGAPWDLGHDDLDRSKYVGPEHEGCNRATARHAKERRKAARHGG